MKSVVGVAVGSQTLKVISDVSQEPMEVQYDEAGLRAIVSLCNGSEAGKLPALITGNRRWAETLAHSLQSQGVEVRYIGASEKGRGQKMDGTKVLKAAMEKGFSGQPFFRNGNGDGEAFKAEETSHPWVQLAAKYEKTNDEIRRAKHRILDSLRVVFPELLQLEEKLWRKKSLEAMTDEKWLYFLELDLDFHKSLGQNLPSERKEEAARRLKEEVGNLSLAELRKAEVKEEVVRLLKDHPVPNRYNDSFSAMMVTLLVGWRDWTDAKGKWTKKGWRRLRAFAGFAVTRIDSKGRARISRKRPIIRVNLYHLQKSGRGKEVVGQAMTRLGKEKMRRIERLEYILKDIWRILAETKVAVSANA